MKRQKMQLFDIIALGIDYHAFQRVKDRNGNRGTRYILSTQLTPEQIAAVNRFKNTVISSAMQRYAPEIKYQTIIILDRIPKEV